MAFGIALAAGQAWAVAAPTCARRATATAIAAGWSQAAASIDVLLPYARGSFDLPGSRPPDATCFGLTATVDHPVALNGGLVLVTLSAGLAVPGSAGHPDPDRTRPGR